MTYKPKPGDRVTSPLLVGEWEVHRHEGGGVWLIQEELGRWVSVHHDYLTPVPTEPVPTLVRTVAEELAYQFKCGGEPAESYMDAAEGVIRVVRNWNE